MPVSLPVPEFIASQPHPPGSLGVSLALRSGSVLWSHAFAVLAVGAALVWIGRVLGLDPVLIVGLVLWLFPFPFVLAAAGAWGREVTA